MALELSGKNPLNPASGIPHCLKPLGDTWCTWHSWPICATCWANQKYGLTSHLSRGSSKSHKSCKAELTPEEKSFRQTWYQRQIQAYAEIHYGCDTYTALCMCQAWREYTSFKFWKRIGSCLFKREPWYESGKDTVFFFFTLPFTHFGTTWVFFSSLMTLISWDHSKSLFKKPEFKRS